MHPSLTDPYRPRFHFSPPANWMNDPNGLVFSAGEYHLFYQYHPGSSVWGPMHWGHAVSPDLVNWQHLPVALYPDDNGMIFSGSAVVDKLNTTGFGAGAIVAIFTHHREGLEAQSLAFSTDNGRSWQKYAGNPVLSPPPGVTDFRDPKVFWYAGRGAGHWVMSLAAGDRILFYTSPDLIHWQPTGSFGPGFGSHGGVWETPDLFELPIDGAPEARWVLSMGIGDGGPVGGSASQYFLGHFDGATFTSENPRDIVLWSDYGADYYAPQSWSNEPAGRRVMLGWLSNWQYARITPSTAWRGTFSLPRELGLTQTSAGVRLVQKPIRELQRLRTVRHTWQDQVIHPGANLLAGVQAKTLEIYAEFEVGPQTCPFGFHVRQGQRERTTIGYLPAQGTLFVDRSHSGQTAFHPAFAAVHRAQLSPVNGIIRLHIFIDHSSVEVFGNDGLVTFTESIFPSGQSQGITLYTEGHEVKLNKLDIYLIS